MYGRDNVFQQRLRRHLGAHFDKKKQQAVVGVCATLSHGKFDSVFGGEGLGRFQFRPQADVRRFFDARRMARYRSSRLNRGFDPCDRLESRVAPGNEGAAASRASSTFADSERGARPPAESRRRRGLCVREAAQSGWVAGVRGLDLDLLRHKCLERLIAFGLVILHGGAAEACDSCRNSRTE